ncbi:ATP-binding protein [Cellulomonas endophytica]|uniref:ATP-binding protein n=1 Tax=Cellulomonas endophytica TaxID=2494735 RepID=UPI00196B8CD8|nr:ATP-binding protein [Cellulomonas endophytica]
MVAEGQDAVLRYAEVPVRWPVLRQWLLDSTRTLRALRGELRAEINTVAGRAEDVDLDDVPEHMALVATELATNALEHGAPPTTTRLSSDGAAFLLEISDHDPASEPQEAGDRTAGDGGFGIRLARLLADEVGWYRTPGEKHVWALFTLPAITPPAGSPAVPEVTPAGPSR